MASKSLGTLTLDLLVQTGGFESGMERAERTANQRTRNIEKQAVERAKAIENAFGNMARSLAAPLASAFSIGAVSSFTSALSQAQQNADKLKNSLTYTDIGKQTQKLQDEAIAESARGRLISELTPPSENNKKAKA